MEEKGRSFRKRRVRFLRLAMMPIVLIPFVSQTTIPEHSSLDFTLEALGYVLVMAGLGLRLWSTLYIGTRKSLELIRQGPYSVCRNPLYLGTYAIVTGVALLFTNPVMLLAIVLLFVPATLVTIKMEERHLEALFGEEYRHYCQRVPRLWPSLRNYASPERLEISTRTAARATLELAGIALLPLAEDLLEILHFHNVLPVLWKF